MLSSIENFGPDEESNDETARYFELVVG